MRFALSLENPLGCQTLPDTGAWEDSELRHLKFLGQWHLAKPGECLWREGSTDSRMGLVLRGQARMLKDAEFPEHPMVVGLFGPGSWMVDFTFFEGRSAETSAIAETELEIVFLSPLRFKELCRKSPAFGNRIYHQALASVSRQLSHSFKRLAVFF